MTNHTARPARAGQRGRVVRRRERAAWLFLTPSLLTVAVFMLWPMVQSLYLSFMDYDRIQPAQWAGLGNYTELFQDRAVRNAFGNTVLYAVVVTPATVGLALALAMFLNRAVMARSFIRTAVFLPFIVSLATVAIAWSFLLDPNIGLVSYWLDGLGIGSEQGWLSDPDLAMPAVMLVGIWKNVGFYMVMYLAGLQSIPTELYEAAELDGTRAWTRFRHVTWPLLSNQTMLISIMAAIATVQAFDQIYVMTHGGPYFKTETLVMLVYRVGFDEMRLGYGSAISWVLLAMVFVLSMLQFGYFRKRAVTY